MRSWHDARIVRFSLDTASAKGPVLVEMRKLILYSVYVLVPMGLTVSIILER